jgi:hypothetical protein
VVAVAVLPDAARVRAWCGVASSSLSEEDLTVIYDAEAFNQATVCRLPDPADDTQRTPDQVTAFYRRCARQIAAKGVPLGTAPGSDEFGPQRLASFDGEIERLERPYRKVVFG